MIIVGIPEFIAFCLKHPGESIYQMACQGSELMIGLGKLFCDKSGTGKYDMPELLGNFFDLTGTCMVYHNKVDFSKILKHLENEKLLIFDGTITPIIERMIEMDFPPLMKYLVQILDNFEIGDAVHPLLAKICSQLKLDVWSLQHDKIAKIFLKNDEQLQNSVNIDLSSEEFAESIKQMEMLHKNQNHCMANALQYQSVLINNQL